jgi:hypothetical protein
MQIRLLALQVCRFSGIMWNFDRRQWHCFPKRKDKYDESFARCQLSNLNFDTLTMRVRRQRTRILHSLPSEQRHCTYTLHQPTTLSLPSLPSHASSSRVCSFPSWHPLLAAVRKTNFGIPLKQQTHYSTDSFVTRAAAFRGRLHVRFRVRLRVRFRQRFGAKGGMQFNL